MQNRLLTLMLTVVAAVSFSPLLWAQTPARPEAAKNTPDLSGMWIQEPGKLTRRFSADDAPLQPWALEIYKANRGGATDPNGNGSNGLDPTMYCLQSGVPRVYTSPFPIEIVQTPGRIYMVFHTQSNPSPRYIYTDGQGHPEGFVVDTVAIDEVTWIDDAGTPHSEALHVVERFRRVDHNTLEIEFRFEDPKAFTKPWTAKKVYKLTPDWQYIPGFTCEDRFKTDFAQKSLRDKKDWIEFKK
ncbi:MAG: hypothetical protein DMG17_14340 [Acidobacteria bacterium]|nr:MAG: hypothetical protein DMG17_14340 [Acidobacteriota bacterium]